VNLFSLCAKNRAHGGGVHDAIELMVAAFMMPKFW
jgi:hypothetical protein